MKALRAWCGVVVLGAAGVGCVSATQSARMYAAAEFACPAEQVRVEEFAGGTIRARGCGREAFYLDHNASATTADDAAPGRVRFRLATNRGSR